MTGFDGCRLSGWPPFGSAQRRLSRKAREVVHPPQRLGVSTEATSRKAREVAHPVFRRTLVDPLSLAHPQPVNWRASCGWRSLGGRLCFGSPWSSLLIAGSDASSIRQIAL